jgi:CBS domain-containing protein
MLLVAGVAWLAEMNALLAVFNLLPAYPLDGGRVLRAGLWRHWNDRLRATDAAARAGAVIGGLMIALGALGWIAEPALAYDGIWLALVGWFVLGASRSEAAAVRSTSTLDGLLVSDAMVPVAAPSYATIEDLVGRHLLPNGLQSCPLVELSGEVSGMVSVDDLARVPREHWPVTRAAQVAWPVGSLVAVAPSDALGGAARLLGTRPSHGALVLDRGRVLGTLSLRDLDRVTHARTVVPGGAAPPFAHVGG